MQRLVFMMFLCFVALHEPMGVTAQPSPYNFFQECPEGCRPVDMIQSCGSVQATTFCEMSPNGDVLLMCSDGVAFSLGQFGCSNNMSSPTVISYFFDHTRTCITLVSDKFTETKSYLAPCMIVLAVWITVAGYRFISPTLTIFAFVWEFFFGLYLMIMAGAASGLALGIALGLGAFVALLCLWKGPLFGRAVVGVSLGSLISILALTLAEVPVGYLSIFVVIACDVVGIAFAYLRKRSSIIALFAASVVVLLVVAIASLSNHAVLEMKTNAEAALMLILPSFFAAIVCVGVNVFWVRLKDKQRLVNRRFQNHIRGADGTMLLDVSTTRPGGSPRSGSPRSKSRTPQSTPKNGEYGAVYEGFSSR